MRFSVLFGSCWLLWGSLHTVGQNPVYDLNVKPTSAQVSILAISTSVHQNFAGNQEIYLADVSSGKHLHQLARLVDSYSPSGLPIRRALLMDLHLFRMKLTRDPDCDGIGSTFFLGRDSSIFDPGTSVTLQSHATNTIPCFQVDHNATRFAK